MTEEENIITQRIRDRVLDELEPIDMEQRVADCIDECYSFQGVGGLFDHMMPSDVLKHMDPVAFRCMVADEGDAEDIIEGPKGDYYDRDAYERIDAEIRDEYAAEKAFSEEAEAAAET